MAESTQQQASNAAREIEQIREMLVGVQGHPYAEPKLTGLLLAHLLVSGAAVLAGLEGAAALESAHCRELGARLSTP